MHNNQLKVIKIVNFMTFLPTCRIFYLNTFIYIKLMLWQLNSKYIKLRDIKTYIKIFSKNILVFKHFINVFYIIYSNFMYKFIIKKYYII